MEIYILKQKFQSYSGLVLVFFLFFHLAGIIFAGLNPYRFEKYASYLHSSFFLPYLEITLSVIFVIHIFLTLEKVLKNRSMGNTAFLMSRRNDFLGVLASKIQPFTGVILISFLIIHLFQLRFPRPGDNLELYLLRNKLHSIYTIALYSLASLSLFFHLVKGIESGHRSIGILNRNNSSKIRYLGRLISILFGLSYLIMTFYFSLN